MNHKSLRIATFTAFITTLLVPLAALAQTFPPYTYPLADDTGKVDRSGLTVSADALKSLEVTSLALVLSSSGQADNPFELVRSASKQFGLTSQSGDIPPSLFAVVVVLNPPRSALVYGSDIKGTLEQIDPRGTQGRTVADSIRLDELNSRLQSGDLTGAIRAAFERAAGQISQFRRTAPAATPVPNTVKSAGPNTFDLGTSLAVALFVLVILGVTLLFAPIAYKRWNSWSLRGRRLGALRAQLGQARTTALDMLAGMEFPTDPHEQTQYRVLWSLLANERPRHLAQITAQYKAASARLSAGLAQIEELNKRELLTESAMSEGISTYQQVQSVVKITGEYLSSLDEEIRRIEAQSAGAAQQTDDARKALEEAYRELKTLAATYPDLGLDIVAILAPASEKIAQAEAALRAEPPHRLSAYDSAIGASTIVAQTQAKVRSILQRAPEFMELRARIDSSRKKGFKLPDAGRLIADAMSELSASIEAPFQTGAPPHLSALETAARYVAAQEAIHKQNETALAELAAKGEGLRSHILRAARAFDQADDYSENSWADIRGNGSQAQRYAEEAFHLWKEAVVLNKLSPQSEQDFEGAAQMISRSTGLTVTARRLVDAILSRFENLQESQHTARTEISAAKHAVAQVKNRWAGHDAANSASLAPQLEESERLLQKAIAGANDARPDWIEVVSLARRAIDLADDALRDVRSQEETIQAKRNRLQTVSQQAQASFARAQNFAVVHAADVGLNSGALLDKASSALAEATHLLADTTTGELDDDALAVSVDRSIASYLVAQNEADASYLDAQAEVQRLQTERSAVHAIWKTAREAVEEAHNYIRDYKTDVDRQTVSLLQEAIGSLPEEPVRGSASSLDETKGLAERAQTKAARALKRARMLVDKTGTAGPPAADPTDKTDAAMGDSAKATGSGYRGAARGSGWGNAGSSKSGW